MTRTSEPNLCITWREHTIISRHDTSWREESWYSVGIFVVSIEEREKAKATIFKLLQQEQFGEEMKSLKVEKEIPKSSKILQFSPFLYEEGLIRPKRQNSKQSIGLQCKASNFATLETSSDWIIFAKRAQEQSTRRHWAYKKPCSANDVVPRHTKRLKINQEQVCYLQKKQSTNDSTINGRTTRRAVRCFNRLYKCWIWLLWPFHCEEWVKKRKAMLMSVHVSNYESGAYRSCTQVGHRQVRSIARGGKPNTIISDNGTNIVGA